MPNRIVVALGSVLVLGLALGACGEGGESVGPDGDTVRVVATTSVFADIVAQVGGDLVEVTSLVPRGGEVHTFDPTPSALRDVAEADLVVMNGLGLDDWLRSIVEDSGSTAPIVALGEDLDGVTYLAGDGPGSAVNPHLWLNVAYAMGYVERIIEALGAVAPDRAPSFRDAGDAYLDRLAELDASTRARLAEIPEADRSIVSLHDAFPYFAAAYGLRIVGTVIDAPGQDPSAGEIAALVGAIRDSGVRAVFSEVQFDPKLARIVADEAGVVVESDLYSDTLGDPPVDTYEGLIRWDVDKVVAALRR